MLCMIDDHGAKEVPALAKELHAVRKEIEDRGLMELADEEARILEKVSLAEDATWKSVLGQVRSRGDERFKLEQERMRRLGIVNEGGQATSNEWPADMKPGSKTDVST